MAVRSLSHAIRLPQSEHGCPFYQPATLSTLFEIAMWLSFSYIYVRPTDRLIGQSRPSGNWAAG